MKLVYLRDFVIISGHLNIIDTFFGFSKKVIDEYTILFYQKSKVLSHCSLIINNQRNEIQWNNSFYPLYHYKSKKCEVLTPNYTNILKLNWPLSLNDKGIREFILFNTSLQNRTFHNEVERLIGIEKIVTGNSKLNIDFQSKNFPKKSLKDQFIEQIDILNSIYKECFHGVFLSGGGESRINAAVTHSKNFNKEFITWGHPKDKEYTIASQIAKKIKTKIINIRLDQANLPYKELLQKTGYLVNMQYAYRYAIVKRLFEQFGYDIIWTGWGDINGYPVRYQPSELFSAYYLGLYNGKQQLPMGWNKDWLMDYIQQKNPVVEQIQTNPSPKTFFKLKREIFAPAIFGAVLGVENTIGVVYSPWFNPEIYQSVEYEEQKNPRLISHKIWRTRWKNNLYYQLLKKYCPELNYIKNAKGYYPALFNKYTSWAGLLLAALMKKYESRKRYAFDPVEDRTFIQNELEKILDENIEIFDKECIEQIIKQKEHWSGPDILEYFKLIQIHWFLNLQHEYEK